MPHQSAEAKRAEEIYNNSIAALKMRIVEREQAADKAAKAKSDDKVASAIGDCAKAVPHPATRRKLLDAESKYKSANSSGKDQIIKRLAETLLVKTSIAGAIAAVTTLSLVGIAGLTTPFLIPDHNGNMHEAHAVPHDDGTVNVYTDTNDNGIQDTVQEFQQSGVEYVPSGPVHDPSLGETISDLWDTIINFF